jgi:hypothetical protein
VSPNGGTGTSASRNGALPSSTLPIPIVGLTPSASAIVGRRKSASIRITRLPASASEDARFMALVVLPSDGEAPVTSSERPSSKPVSPAASIPRSVR